ncbi:3-dehydro-L-gulonate 2-dehydrogenase [Acidobacteria bacterium AB60]|nr:3-dehydro-L-gulonate 2-dehydrogenase [Acidobacteria bacterium AB60]
MNRIAFETVEARLAEVLSKLGFTAERALLCARLFAETTRDGVYSHGVNRFPRFVATICNGSVNPAVEPRLVARAGALERWDGQGGPGNLNAYAAMANAIGLAKQHGIGCVALGNTNHWMRGGTYGWQAVEAGVVGICWTNTMPNLPPWGSSEPCIGNNPLVFAVPRSKGPVVLDMAMSQFSYGALESYRRRGEMLPVPGGIDERGEVTCDPAAVETTQRLLPIGYWKGSGLAIVLDMLAATLSLGRATHQIASDALRETQLSQVFVAINPDALGGTSEMDSIADGIVASLHRCQPTHPHDTVRYPGEQTLRLRKENQELGLPVDSSVWTEIMAL